MSRLVTALRDRVQLRSRLRRLAVRALIANPSIAIPQPVEDGTQYYRLHPDLTAAAGRRLADRLKPYAAHPWTQWPGRTR